MPRLANLSWMGDSVQSMKEKKYRRSCIAFGISEIVRDMPFIMVLWCLPYLWRKISQIKYVVGCSRNVSALEIDQIVNTWHSTRASLPIPIPISLIKTWTPPHNILSPVYQPFEMKLRNLPFGGAFRIQKRKLREKSRDVKSLKGKLQTLSEINKILEYRLLQVQKSLEATSRDSDKLSYVEKQEGLGVYGDFLTQK